MSERHPQFRRLSWHPIVPTTMLVYFTARLWFTGITTLRLVATAVAFNWLVLALYDWRSGHKLLDWMYKDD